MTKTSNGELSEKEIFDIASKINQIPKKRIENTPAS